MSVKQDTDSSSSSSSFFSWARFEWLDSLFIHWATEHGEKLLRYSLATVFIWFGILKVFFVSPAVGLVADTVFWFNPSWFVPLLGVWEVVIGVFLLSRKTLRFGIFLMAIQMIGTFLPLLLLRTVTWNGFLILTMEGQYIVKNVVLIAAAIVIASHVEK